MSAPGDVTVIPTACAHNCGGRCVLKAHVVDGAIVRIETDTEPDTPEAPQLRACLRGRSYRTRLYHPDRLRYPMKRVGRRGEGRFVRITWDEALQTIAARTREIVARHGNESVFFPYATGNSGRLSEGACMRRLMGLLGGYLGFYNNYSNSAHTWGLTYTLGTENTASSREDLVNARLILLWGFNPAETVFGTNTTYYIQRAREAGAKVIAIDPRCTDTAVALADQWIPIRPTTDNALAAAIAYVLITENLIDRAFVAQHTLGLDEAGLPEGAPSRSSYSSYVLGESDGIPKTPGWAEALTGIPAATILQLAREYGSVKPAAILMGYGPQRHAYGEQPSRAVVTLQAMTGNIGVKGGSAGAWGWPGYGRAPRVGVLPVSNPVRLSIPAFRWTDAVARGSEMTAADGVMGGDRLPSAIKLIFNLAGNALVNQHADINRTAALLADESRVEFIVVSEQFMTASARFADILLPATTWFERNDLVTPWAFGDYVLAINQAIAPLYEARNAYDWVSDLAELLGLREAFTEGRSDLDWLRLMVDEARQAWPAFPAFDEFRRRGVYKYPHGEPFVAFADRVFPTPSGKVEVYSPRLAALDRPGEVPPIPAYVPAWEGPSDPLRAEYPLQCTGYHTKRRCHSIYDNSPWLEEVEPQALWINPLDAARRRLQNGDRARVYNDRGAMELPVRVTPRIMPGVVAIPQGAWWEPDGEGVCRRGALNVLTSYVATPVGHVNTQHTMLVEVSRGGRGGCGGRTGH